MEPFTHFLTGACLSRAGFNRTTGLATLTLVLSAEAPDIDVIAGFWGPVAGFAHHRGFSHTLLGAPVMSAIVVASVWLGYKLWSRSGRRTRLPVRWWVLYLLALAGSLSHILLDFTNNYGVRPFAPFNARWYSWDIIFIIEPVLLIVLALGLILPAIFSLVSAEVGEKRRPFRGQTSAICALVLMVVFWLVRDVQHRQALAMLNSRAMQTGATMRVGAMPYPVNPFRWFGVVETTNAYETFDVETRELHINSNGREGTYYKPPESAADLAAKNSYLGRVYLDWARFPLTETSFNAEDQQYTVYFRDVRYMYSPLSSRDEADIRNTLAAHVVLDHNLNVVEQWMGNREQK
ncbi:MAG: metal-dependent hydrolase [Acidobacteriaceae bacterium]